MPCTHARLPLAHACRISSAPPPLLRAGIMSAALFGHALTLNFLLGVTIVFISMHQFFAQGAALLLCSCARLHHARG